MTLMITNDLPMFKLDPDAFRLAWWRITKESLNISRALKDSTLVAITINGASNTEKQALKDWCADNQIYKLYKSDSWEDYYDRSGVLFEFMNNETTVLAEPEIMSQLEKWLDSLPKRNLAVLVEGIARKEINQLANGHVARIIKDTGDPLNQDRYVVSVADSSLATELALRSD